MNSPRKTAHLHGYLILPPTIFHFLSINKRERERAKSNPELNQKGSYSDRISIYYSYRNRIVCVSFYSRVLENKKRGESRNILFLEMKNIANNSRVHGEITVSIFHPWRMNYHVAVKSNRALDRVRFL